MKLSQLTLYSGRLLFSSLHTGGTRCVASVRRQSRFAKDKMASAKSSILPISYLSQVEAQNVDIDLMNEFGYEMSQLMELAGLSCAVAVTQQYPRDNLTNKGKVLVCCGPGNNGGDGLVCARHLKLFGYSPCIYYPKRTDKPLYNGLVKQCTSFGVSFTTDLTQYSDYDLIIDAVFGFSFKPPTRELFIPVMDMLIETKVPVVSIDVPSGVDVDNGDAEGLQPDMLISLTAPKFCSKLLTKTHHYLGGRFLPQPLIDKYKLTLPEYPGTSLCVKLSSPE